MSCDEFTRLLTHLNTRIKASKRLSKYVYGASTQQRLITLLYTLFCKIINHVHRPGGNFSSMGKVMLFDPLFPRHAASFLDTGEYGGQTDSRTDSIRNAVSYEMTA